MTNQADETSFKTGPSYNSLLASCNGVTKVFISLYRIAHSNADWKLQFGHVWVKSFFGWSGQCICP